MKRLLNVLFCIAVLTSCQIEDDATPSPDDAYIRYYGDLTSFEAKDIEIVLENGQPSGFVVLGTRLNPDPDIDQTDFYVLRTDLSGDTIRSASFALSLGPGDVLKTDTISRFDVNEDGSIDENDVIRGNSNPGKILVLDNGFLVVGTSMISEKMVLTAAVLNEQLDVVVPYIRVADDNLVCNDVIQLSTGGFLFVGKQGSEDAGDDFDSYLLKLNNGGNVVFEKTLGVTGTGENEEAVRVFEKGNNLVLIGSSFTNSRLGENNGNNGQNAYFIELDPNGNPINRRYYGVDHFDPENTAVFDDMVTNAIEVPSGYVIVGTSTSSQNETYGFAISLDHNGEFQASATLPSADFPGLQTSIMGVTPTRDNDLILVGQYPGFTSNGVGKSGEAMFMKVDQSMIPFPGNESNFGLTDGNDEFVDAVTLPDGSIVVAGNIDFGAGAKLVSVIKLNDTGNLQD